MAAKCYRKAALCYIEQKEYAKASTVVRRCTSNEAATHYVVFLTALFQGPALFYFSQSLEFAET
jgi:hypothetical protein